MKTIICSLLRNIHINVKPFIIIIIFYLSLNNNPHTPENNILLFLDV